jgi:hypothetical protein
MPQRIAAILAGRGTAPPALSMLAVAAALWWPAAAHGISLAGARAAAERIAVVSGSEPHDAERVSQPTYERLLVGLVLSRREVGALEVLRDRSATGAGRFLVPLEPFLELSGCRLVEDGESLAIETPLGIAELRPEDVVRIEGVRYLDGAAIEDELATPVTFDEQSFALRFDLAWRPPGDEAPRRPSEHLRPEAEPPAISLSSIRLDAQYLGSDFTGERVDSDMLLSGRVADGRWQLRWLDDFEGEHRWQDYAWLRVEEDRLWLAGHQRVQLHPLLPGLELTGVQGAWTNQPLALFARAQRPGQLLPRRLRPVDSYEGTGPAAGVAELRIDGRVIDRQTIGLDGRFAFYDVRQSSRQLDQAEVYVYDRHDLSVPIAIHEHRRSASEFLLPDGAVLHQGGLGYDGNLAQDAFDGSGGGELAGFYQGRYGLSRRLTVETAAAGSADRLQLMGGVVARLSDHLVTSLGVGTSDGAAGYSLDLDGLWPRWQLRGRSQLHQAGFQRADSDETFDHLLEVTARPTRRLELGAVARSRRQPGREAEFVLPTLAWRPFGGVSIRARPDEKGDYVGDLGWRIGRRTRFAAHYQDDRAFVDLSRQLGRRASLFLGAQTGGDPPQRYSATWRRTGSGPWRLTWTAGAIYGAGELGYRVGASAAVLPGVLARLDWEDDPLPVGGDGRRAQRLLFGLTTDLTWSRGRLLAARSRGIGDDRGAVAGKVEVEAGGGVGRYDLAGLRIQIDGRAVGRTERGGSFFVGNLREGVYRLELDPDNLPIELTPVHGSVVVAVSGGAVTHADFVVRPEYGVAGRVTDGRGNHLAGVAVEIVDGGGRRVGAAVSDRFGLFRLDGLAIGRYTLRVVPESAPGISPRSSRPLEIRDEFLFGQDLVLPPAPAAAPNGGPGVTTATAA